ncbi:MAG: hypothetical protein D6744_06610 [Planctomycetota bacterium]|nr:MAG: hypothetical protein D6744_06610 [Planctomycetota bacterium]
MNFEDLLARLMAMAAEQLRLPQEYAWAPAGATIVALLAGLLLLVRGARWAPGFTALAFLGLGGVGGYYLTPVLGTPQLATIGVVGVAAALLGVGLFRFWQALALSACLMCIGMSVYFARVLAPEVDAWMEPAPANVVDIQLPQAGSVVGEQRETATAKLASLWSHLSAHVPHFQVTFWSLIASTGLAGLIFGLLLPRASRALWGTSIGTVLFGTAAAMLLKKFAPDALAWLQANPNWGWGVVAAIWLGGFLHNYRDTRRRRRSGDAGDDVPVGADAARA